MKDILDQLNHLECEITDCKLIAKMAADPAKRQQFNELAAKYTEMRDQLRVLIDRQNVA